MRSIARVARPRYVTYLCAFAVFATQPAWSQSTESSELEEVVVTGFRDSLEKALDVKRESAIASDVILAEDIGKFPDLNLSESIQRIPGVALARDGGEGRQIAVRGLGAQFTRVRINGMEAMATTGSADASGGANRGRSFDFNVFASDLFSGITVAKTAEAAQEEGSLGATVDLQTARPFDVQGFKLVGSAQASYNELSEKTRPRVAALISNTFFDDRVGVLISAAFSRRDTIEEGSSTVRWGTNVGSFPPGFESAPAGTTLADLNAAFHPRFPRYDHYDNHNERLGVTAAIQWKPTDATLVSFDALYADFDATRREFYLEAPSFSQGAACTAANRSTSCGVADFNVTQATISNGVLTRGTFNDVDLRMENRFDILETKFKQGTLSVSHEFNDRFSMDFVGGHSESDHDNPFQTTLTFDQFNVQGYSYDFTDSRHPAFTYGSADVMSPNGWVLRELRQRKITVENDYDSAKLSAEWKIADPFSLSGGIDYKKYDFVTTELRRVDAAGSSANVEVFTPAQVAQLTAIAPLSSYSQIARLNGSGLDIPGGTPLAWLVPNLERAYEIFNINDQTALNGLFRLGIQPALTNNKSVTEKDQGAFVQGNFSMSVFDMPLRGNFGVRYIKTKQSSDGFVFAGGNVVALTVDRDYTDTLPSLNIVLEPREDLLLRLSAAKTMSRPDLVQLSPGAAFNVAGSTRAVTAGNPGLNPFRAKTVDLAAEWYFQPGSLLSVAVFQKKIDSFVQNVTTNQTFANNPFGLPDSAAVAACGNQTNDCNATSTIWSFSAPMNSDGDTLAGYEINYQQPLRFLPGFLTNTGVLLNYTNVEAKQNYINAQRVTIARADLVNLSPRSYNATLYYEDDRISTRVSAAYRSRYLTQVPGAENTAIIPIPYQGTNSTLNVDASFQLTVTENLKLSLEGINLTDEFQDQFIGTQDLLSVYHHTGREFLIGARYSF
jgi:iron complex outermembrane receptor protein